MTLSEAALRGYVSPRRRRQERARKAGLASGRARRRLCDPCRRRAHARELALNFRVRLVDREEFDRRDFARRVRLDIAPNERGTETLWQEYLSCARTFKAKGQGFITTNGQRARALELAGRPRCGRTVRRAHAALADMGLLRRFHDRRCGAREGRRDRLRVQFAPSFVPPPSAAPTAPRSGTAVGASKRPDSAPDGRRSPPDGGLAPAPPANGSDKEEGANATGGSLGAGGSPESLREARARLEALLREGPPGGLRDRGGDGR